MKYVDITIKLIFVVLFGAFVYALFTFNSIAQKQVNQQIRANCAEAYTVEFQDQENSSLIRTPIQEKYQECLVENGL